MLTSIALIIFTGVIIDWISKKINVPSLIGFIFAGIIMGPSAFNILQPALLEISGDIRQIILIIILTRAGLSLNLRELKKVGRPAALLSFVPATFEILGTVIFASVFLDLSLLESALLGTVLCAVSPAVVVPRMVTLIREKFGTKKGIPQLLLAGASIDDIYGLVLFASFLSLAQNGSFQASAFFELPLSLISAVIIGCCSGYLLSKIFGKIKLVPVMQVLLMLSVSLGFIQVENGFPQLPFSGILAVMTMAIMIYRLLPSDSEKIARIYNQLWIPGEMFLFILVGASVNIIFGFSAGWRAVFVVLLVLIVRMAGVWVSLLGTNLNKKEKLFCLIAYSPKATVQAAIGAVPMALGLPSGELILTVSVVSILLTAPMGAFGMDFTYKRLLTKDTTSETMQG